MSVRGFPIGTDHRRCVWSPLCGRGRGVEPIRGLLKCVLQRDYNNCIDLQFVGPTEVIQLRPKESASVRIGRNALNELGTKLASEAEIADRRTDCC